MKRRDFIKGMTSVTVLSFSPMPVIFKNRDKWNGFNTLTDDRPEKEHHYAMVIVQNNCIGCRACEKACKGAWDISEESGHFRTRVLYGAQAQSNNTKMTWLPVLCNQCDNAPCVKVCPTKASYKRPEDGIILVDAAKCIGCKTCIVACPYDARYYSEEKHTVDKCTFCLPKVQQGQLPACVERCPMQVRFFGDLLDPHSNVSKILKKAVSYHVLKPEAGTKSNVFYTQEI